MEKIHENMCFDVVFLYENIRTCLFTYVFRYFLHLVLTFTPPLHHNGKGSIESTMTTYSMSSRNGPLASFPDPCMCFTLASCGPGHVCGKKGKRINFCMG